MFEPHEIKELGELAKKAAMAAGAFIQSQVAMDVKVETKGDSFSNAAQVVTEVDRQAQAIILECLFPSLEKFDLAVLTEETPDDGSRLKKAHFWCIDPLDGTLPFVKKRPGYSVSIGLVSNSGKPVLGVVYDPVREQLFTSWEVLDENYEIIRNDELIFVSDQSFFGHELILEVMDELQELAQDLGWAGMKEYYYGGAVMNALWTADFYNAVYFKFPKKEPGGGSLWDYAATAAIYEGRGLHVSDVFGKPLELNRKDSTYLNNGGVLYSANPELVEGVIGIANKLLS